MDHGLRFFTILSSNNSAAALSERATDMKPEEELLLLRREVRDSVFRSERLHRAGRTADADEQLAGELAAAQARLAESGRDDAAGTLLRWRGEDESAFALAELVADLVAERGLRLVPAAQPVFASPSTAASPSAPIGDTAAPQFAFPAPATDIPALADLLDDMLSQERRAPARCS